MLRPAIICDIDGTIADCRHRLHMIQRPLDEENHSKVDWDAFHDAAVSDPVIEEVVDIVAAMNFGTWRIIMITGRGERNRQLTKGWLKRNNIPCNLLLMRKDGDYRSDWIVKRELFLEHVAGQYEVRFVLEDRDRVVEMWRDLGLRCLQVQKGEY